MTPNVSRVSVVVPVYNGENFIDGCLQALLAQTVPIHEILVMDDGSTDRTAEVIHRASSSPLIQHVPLSHRGVVETRSAGIRMATGDFIGFCDADDRWLPTKLGRQLEAMGNADLVHANTYIVREGKRVGNWSEDEGVHLSSGYKDTLLPILFDRNQINGSSVLVRREIILRALDIPIDPDICLDIDYPVWLRLLEIGAHFKAVDEPLLERHMHKGQLTEKHYLNKRFQEYTLRGFLSRNPGFVREYPWLVRKKFLKMILKMGLDRKFELGKSFPIAVLAVATAEIVVYGWPHHSFEDMIKNPGWRRPP